MPSFPKRHHVSKHTHAAVAGARAKAQPQAAQPAANTAWEAQAGWYDQMLGDDGDDFYRTLILPAVLKRLAAKPGERVLDLACGQGILGRALAHLGVGSTGVDASPALVAAAQARANPLEKYVVGDVRDLGDRLAGERFDHAALVMAAQDLDPLDPVLKGAAGLVAPGGRLVIALTHPAFRVPRRSAWGWDADKQQQYRRLDGYLSTMAVRLKTHPGAAAGTPEAEQYTLSFHRPIGFYLNVLGATGWGATGAEELCSHRRGSKGVRSAAEDLARREFPIFLVLVATRLP